MASSHPPDQRVEITEVRPGRRRDRERFVELPFRLARRFPAWQPGIRMLARDLLDPEKNPFWRGRTASFFVAVRGRKVVGRMGVLGPGEVPERPQAAVLLFPDFVDDPSVVGPLVDRVANRAGELGATEMIGPMNPSIHHDIGIQVAGFDRPNALLMGYQPDYYARSLEALDFLPLTDFHAWGLFRETFRRNGRIRDLAERVRRASALRIRSVDLGRFDEELEVLFRLYSGSFDDHWGFVPPTREEFRFLADDLRRLLRPEMLLIAEWDGEPVGFVLGVPDVYSILPRGTGGHLTPRLLYRVLRGRSRIEVVRVMLAGVLPSHRSRGIHLPLFHRIACEIFDLGFRGGEISWVMKENRAMARALRLLGAAPTKTFRLYEKALRS